MALESDWSPPSSGSPLQAGTAPETGLQAAMLDALGEAVIATDREGRIVFWNDAATRLYGWTADQVMGAQALELMGAEWRRQDAERILVRLRRGESWSGEFVVRHRDGRRFPVRVSDSAVLDDRGRVQAFVAVSRDISREREDRETLRHTEDRLDLVRRATATALWEWEPETDRIHWSGTAGDAFGYDPAAMGPRREWWTERIHPEDRARVDEGFRRFVAEEGTFWTEEYRFLTGDRGYATVFHRAFVSRSTCGAATRVVGTVTDTTDRRRLREGQRFLSQASMILDLSMDYEATLPTIARLAAHAIADYCVLHVLPGVGTGGTTATAHVDPRLQSVVDEAGAFLAAGPPAGSVAERVLQSGESVLVPAVGDDVLAPLRADPRPGGTETLAPRSAMVVPFRARGEVVGFALLARSDDQRPYDTSDLHLVEDLGRRIGLAVDHARLFQSAELANRAKSNFLAVISHEVRTPLTAVLGYADLLGGEISGTLNQTQHRQVQRIRAGSDRLLRLIEDILAFARLEAGADRPRYERVSFRALLHRVEEIAVPGAVERGIEVRIVLDDAPVTIETDPEKFIQVLLSLLTNAVKFTRDVIRVRAGRQDGMATVDVMDNGSGIPGEHLPYVFNPFWQAEQPATRRAGGAGIGLSLARRLARLMNGDVLVSHTAPGGTTFRFQVPLERRD